MIFIEKFEKHLQELNSWKIGKIIAVYCYGSAIKKKKKHPKKLNNYKKTTKKKELFMQVINGILATTKK